MARLEDLTKGARVLGFAGAAEADVVSAAWMGSSAVTVVYRLQGQLHEAVVYAEDAERLSVVSASAPMAFTGDGAMFRLLMEAQRIRLAHLHDPYVALTSSTVTPLPHQISAVYEYMLPRQPLRFLLADDPGAGKTVMAGLLIKEMMVRGDVQRCLVVAPGSLVDQWQDELKEKFSLDFDIFGRDMAERAVDGNPFTTSQLLICRMDQLSRNEDLQTKLKQAPEWDLIICDEAHRMAAHYMGSEVEYTKRYTLGRELGKRSRNLLLMSATPHNGNEADFQLFLGLLDQDRFEGKFREGVHSISPEDLMRRLVKEELRKFDGAPLFPNRVSNTVRYELSDAEAALYAAVTEYVRNEMNRAERVEAGNKRSSVGFALMTLQRRLASSPEAIYKSLVNRQKRLETWLRDERMQYRGKALRELSQSTDVDELYDDLPAEQLEELEQEISSSASAAQTAAELAAELTVLERLVRLANDVRSRAQDSKWLQLADVLASPELRDHTPPRKLIIFTEFRDTLEYIAARVRTHIGKSDAVVEIHGGVTRDERKRIVAAFMNDPDVRILVANDAAGEGVNLQRANLMVNYDLPWNPNRLEQRFGRIHRIGQAETCHLWNLIAKDTREGDVYYRLLEKIERAREALGGRVYDVLGTLFENRPLRELLMQAVCELPDVPVLPTVDELVSNEHLHALLQRRALATTSLNLASLQHMQQEMQRAETKRLQPFYMEEFFVAALRQLGGTIARRELQRYEITRVPMAMRSVAVLGEPLPEKYERICFDPKAKSGASQVTLVAAGASLLTAAISAVSTSHGSVLKQGTLLIDDQDAGTVPRVLFAMRHGVIDGRRTSRGEPHYVSEQILYVEAGPNIPLRQAPHAPYLDYRVPTADESTVLATLVDQPWLKRPWLDEVSTFVVMEAGRAHVKATRDERLAYLDKVEGEVKRRLHQEISYWDAKLVELREKERAGKPTGLPAHQAEVRVRALQERLQARLEELARERQIQGQAPELLSGALIVPRGLVAELLGTPVATLAADQEARKRVEMLAMQAVMEAEARLGRTPRDVSRDKCGWDIESWDARTNTMVHVEVKGRDAEAETVTLTRNEILCAKNAGPRFRLAIVTVAGAQVAAPVYVERFDWGSPGFEQTSSNFSLAALLAAGRPPF